MRTKRLAVMGSSKSWEWKTSAEAYEALNQEFKFDHDPSPTGGRLGLLEAWGKMNYVNPPYGRGMEAWLTRAVMEREKGNGSVFNIPARTDTRWFHEIVIPFADEVRFVRGRQRFGGAKHSAPFLSIIVIFRPRKEGR